MIIYYARPYSYKPTEARRLYQLEAEHLHKLTKDLIVCTIPLTDYTLISDVEEEVFQLARHMIIACDVLVYKGDSEGVELEKSMARRYGVRVVEYSDFIMEYNR